MRNLTCNRCGVTKTEDKYKLPWQRREKICDYCKNQHGQIGAVDKPIFKMKKLKCLRCSKEFNTIASVRTCKSCKDSPFYKEDQYIQYITQASGVV